MKKIFFAMLAFALLPAFPLSASEEAAKMHEVEWQSNFGGSGDDIFNSVTALSDGFVAVGRSSEDSFGNGDWEGVTGRGGHDAIIVRYDNDGKRILVSE